MLQKTEEKFRISEDKRIKFVSKCGTKMIDFLQRKNPFDENCMKDDCKPCESVKEESNKLSKCRAG